MTDENHLPTPDQMLDRAESDLVMALDALESAAGWLRSDWRPLGSALTGAQAARRKALRRAVITARSAIETAQHGAGRADP